MDDEGAGPLHDIKGAPGEALGQLTEVFREVGHCHAALPVEGLQVVDQEQCADTSSMTCTKRPSHATCSITGVMPHTMCATHDAPAHNQCDTQHHIHYMPHTIHQTHTRHVTHTIAHTMCRALCTSSCTSHATCIQHTTHAI